MNMMILKTKEHQEKCLTRIKRPSQTIATHPTFHKLLQTFSLCQEGTINQKWCDRKKALFKTKHEICMWIDPSVSNTGKFAHFKKKKWICSLLTKERVEKDVLFKILLKKVNKTFSPRQAD